jgi:hypothetical protein
MRPLLALAVFLLDAWALSRLFGARVGAARTLAWTAAILLLPFLGAFLWLRRGPRMRPLNGEPYERIDSRRR